MYTVCGQGHVYIFLLEKKVSKRRVHFEIMNFVTTVVDARFMSKRVEQPPNKKSLCTQLHTRILTRNGNISCIYSAACQVLLKL